MLRIALLTTENTHKEFRAAALEVRTYHGKPCNSGRMPELELRVFNGAKSHKPSAIYTIGDMAKPSSCGGTLTIGLQKLVYQYPDDVCAVVSWSDIYVKRYVFRGNFKDNATLFLRKPQGPAEYARDILPGVLWPKPSL